MPIQSDAASENRRNFPEFSRVVDEYRAVFGEVKVKWAKENGKTIGKVPDEP